MVTETGWQATIICVAMVIGRFDMVMVLFSVSVCRSNRGKM